MKIQNNKPLNICKNVTFISLVLCLQNNCFLTAQDIIPSLTLEDVIQVAKSQSIDALIAKQVFQQSYWEYKTYKAEKLPLIDFDIGLIDYNRSTTNRGYDYETGDYRYYSTNANTSGSRLSINQNIPLTGGSVVAGFDIIRNDNFDLGTWDYTSNPSIRIQQPLFSYNKYKWNNKIEPKKYVIAKARYNQDLEDVSASAVNHFFDLAKSQVELEVSRKNLLNADTLYKISQGRYQMGKIAEDDLLQMELNLLNSKTSMSNAEIALYDSKIKLLSFLHINTNRDVILIIPDSVPDLEVDIGKAISEAKQNNPEMIVLENYLLQAQQQVAQKKSEKGLNMNMELAWGYSRIDSLFPDIITNKNNISDYKNVRLGVKVPIVNWGVNKGYYKVALLNEEIVQLQVDQANNDFEQGVTLQVMNFNQQKNQFAIAQKSEIVAEKRYIVSKHQFIIGKIDAIDLNISQKDCDAEKKNYINSLREYWNAFYSLRKTTLYNFINDTKIDNLNKTNFK